MINCYLQINQITVQIIESYKTAIDFCDKSYPQNTIEGKFSLQHCCAISLKYGNIKEDHFKENILNDTSIKEIRKKIIIKPNTKMTKNFPNNYSASLSIKFNDGSVLNRLNRHAKGDPENPMSQKEICDKTLDLINSNSNGFQDCELLIKKIMNSDGKYIKNKLIWFEDLQDIISKGSKKC